MSLKVRLRGCVPATHKEVDVSKYNSYCDAHSVPLHITIDKF